jgi:hypothetical protein
MPRASQNEVSLAASLVPQHELYAAQAVANRDATDVAHFGIVAKHPEEPPMSTPARHVTSECRAESL